VSRIRTIKPEFQQSESMGRVSRDARLLFIELWTLADDEGRSRASSRMLASLLFPFDDDAPSLIEGWLKELEREQCIHRYSMEGTTYLQVQNWEKHQKIDHPAKSRLPPPPDKTEILANPRELSRSLAPDLVPRTIVPRKEIVTPPEPKETPRSVLLEVLTPETADGVIEHRRKLRAPLTVLAARGLVKGFNSTADPDDAARTMVARGWRGFELEWYEKHRNSGNERSAGRSSLVNAGLNLIRKLDEQAAGSVRSETGGKAGDWHASLLPAP